jgi:hypothetical protein
LASSISAGISSNGRRPELNGQDAQQFADFGVQFSSLKANAFDATWFARLKRLPAPLLGERQPPGVGNRHPFDFDKLPPARTVPQSRSRCAPSLGAGRGATVNPLSVRYHRPSRCLTIAGLSGRRAAGTPQSGAGCGHVVAHALVNNGPLRSHAPQQRWARTTGPERIWSQCAPSEQSPRQSKRRWLLGLGDKLQTVVP